MSDDELRALERATVQAPEDPEAWLARGQGAARVGARDEALDAFYRSAALGGALPAIREGLRALGAPASPWGHEEGDAARTRCSPLRGPRKGEIVARAPLPHVGPVVIAEDGTVLVAGTMTSRIARLDGRTLAALPPILLDETWADVKLAAGAGLTVGRAHGGSESLLAIEATRARRVFTTTSAHYAAPRIEGADLFLLSIDPDAQLLQVHSLNAGLERRHRFGLGEDALDFAVDARRVAAFNSGGAHYATLLVATHAGPEVFRHQLRDIPFAVPVLGAKGRVFYVTRSGTHSVGTLYHLEALDEGGAPVGHVDFHLRDHGFDYAEVAATPDGGAWLATENELMRVDADGRLAWTEDYWSRAQGSLVADREGWSFTQALDGDRSIVEGNAPDRSARFEVEGDYRPVAIDAFGRLLAVSSTEARTELVAIA